MHTLDIFIYVLALAATGAAYLRDPGAPVLGLRASLALFWDILPRLVAALILTGMLQVLISPEWIQRYLGKSAGNRGIFVAFAAGVLTPGGPMLSFPMMAVFYQSGASLSALVTYMTSWSLFGFQRVFAWELPFMGGRFVLARILPSLALPIVAGYLVRLLYRD
ncbi:MAG: permease [Candidatus Rokubacteria bacterium]|nr:permease [Candidatus Rokubacteria bacterium]